MRSAEIRARDGFWLPKSGIPLFRLLVGSCDDPPSCLQVDHGDLPQLPAHADRARRVPGWHRKRRGRVRGGDRGAPVFIHSVYGSVTVFIHHSYQCTCIYTVENSVRNCISTPFVEVSLYLATAHHCFCWHRKRRTRVRGGDRGPVPTSKWHSDGFAFHLGLNFEKCICKAVHVPFAYVIHILQVQ